MIGMPPATAASNATMTPRFCAAPKISLPCFASSALLAVTTCLPCAMASSTSSRATPVPPISSMTMSMSRARVTANASAVTAAPPPTTPRARSTAVSATRAMRMARPARR